MMGVLILNSNMQGIIIVLGPILSTPHPYPIANLWGLALKMYF
jgi:hypothetical protein